MIKHERFPIAVFTNDRVNSIEHILGPSSPDQWRQLFRQASLHQCVSEVEGRTLPPWGWSLHAVGINMVALAKSSHFF